MYVLAESNLQLKKEIEELKGFVLDTQHVNTCLKRELEDLGNKRVSNCEELIHRHDGDTGRNQCVKYMHRTPKQN